MPSKAELLELKAQILRESPPEAIIFVKRLVDQTTMDDRFNLLDPKKLEQLILGALWMRERSLDLDRLPIIGRDCE